MWKIITIETRAKIIACQCLHDIVNQWMNGFRSETGEIVRGNAEHGVRRIAVGILNWRYLPRYDLYNIIVKEVILMFWLEIELWPLKPETHIERIDDALAITIPAGSGRRSGRKLSYSILPVHSALSNAGCCLLASFNDHRFGEKMIPIEIRYAFTKRYWFNAVFRTFPGH